MHDSVGEMSSTPVSVVDIEPMNFRQVFEEEQQLVSVRPTSSIFQQTGGIRNVINGNFTRAECCPKRRHKEVYEAADFAKTRIWVKDKAFNGLLTVVDDQRGRIEESGAIRVKEEVTQPIRNSVLQDIFGFDHRMGMNQVRTFIYNSPQALSIRDIMDVSYLPEGSRHISFYPKRKVY